MVILAGVRYYLIVVLICISLIVMLSIFSRVCQPPVLLIWRNVCFLKRSSHFLIALLAFLILNCMSFLYILEINPLSVVSFAIIFSNSEGCLFTLLVVSFAVQKLLSLIRSHLLTFVFLSITLGGGS